MLCKRADVSPQEETDVSARDSQWRTWTLVCHPSPKSDWESWRGVQDDDGSDVEPPQYIRPNVGMLW